MYDSEEKIKKSMAGHAAFAADLERMQSRFPKEGFSVDHYRDAVSQIVYIRQVHALAPESIPLIRDHVLRTMLLMHYAGIVPDSPRDSIARKSNNMCWELFRAAARTYLCIADSATQDMTEDFNQGRASYSSPETRGKISLIQDFLDAVDLDYLSIRKRKFFHFIKRSLDRAALQSAFDLLQKFEQSAALKTSKENEAAVGDIAAMLSIVRPIKRMYVEDNFEQRINAAVSDAIPARRYR